jgi:hypothetical protein
MPHLLAVTQRTGPPMVPVGGVLRRSCFGDNVGQLLDLFHFDHALLEARKLRRSNPIVGIQRTRLPALLLFLPARERPDDAYILKNLLTLMMRMY